MADLTINPGDVPTAAQFNSYMTHTGSSFNSWTPVVTQGATPTLTVSTATYHRVGRLITFQAVLAITSSGTGATAVSISLPVTAASNASNAPLAGWGVIQDVSATTDYWGPLFVVSTTTMQIGAASNAGTNARLGSSTFTAALVNGDYVKVWGSYEAAAG